MTNKQRLLKLYEEAYDTKQLPGIGLCGSISNCRPFNRLDLFSPNEEEKEKLRKEFKSTGYWGYDKPAIRFIDYAFEFTTLRQTILALLIAMED